MSSSLASSTGTCAPIPISRPDTDQSREQRARQRMLDESTPAAGHELGDTAGDSALNAARRGRELRELGDADRIDVLVVGGGVTGAGVALDAAARGLRTVLVEAHDLAFGTSRWSSKLVHGGLRYLASGGVGIAHESAVERDILLTTTAPHLTRSIPQLVPAFSGGSVPQRLLVRAGFLAGDVLRRSAGTSPEVLPRSRRVAAAEALRLAPTLRRAGLRGGMTAWDGQLVDDARLVVTIARTAAAHGAAVLTRVRAEQVSGDSAVLHDVLTGETLSVRARSVINAAGVWADLVDPSIELRPSRGTHLVFDAAAFGGLTASLTVPVPGTVGRFIFALPAPHGRVYLGLTDEDAPGPVPDEPRPTETEIDFLLDTVNTVLRIPLTHTDIRGTYAGLRPLLRTAGDSTADISREHAVLTAPSGLVTVVGGKLTTYRKMAQDAVDAAVTRARLSAGPCRTKNLPLAGAVAGAARDRLAAPQLLIERYGADAPAVVALTAANPDLAVPVAPGADVLAAEFRWSLEQEG